MTSWPRATRLDHVALLATDAHALFATFERLGFTLTPLARQSGRLHPDGPIQLFGTANRCAMFAHGYLELQAVLDPALPANGLDRFLARHEGLHNMTLGMEDDAGNLDRLRRTGLETPGLLELERPVDDADPAGPRARFRRLPLPDGAWGRWQLVRHLTPEAIWQPRFMTHPNHTVALDTLLIASAQPEAEAARLSALAGWPVTPDPAGGFRLDLPAGPPKGSVRILDPAALATVLPGTEPPALPVMAGIVLRTDDGAGAARRHPGHPVPDGWCIEAAGAALVFQ